MSSVSNSQGIGSGTVSRTVDWAVTLVTILAGLLFAAGGAVLYSSADRSWIAAAVAEGTVHSDGLTDAQLVDALHGLAWWGGIGLAVTGLLFVIAGVAFMAYRTRWHRRRAETGETGPDTTTNAVIGAVVTVVTSFVPISPVLGGAVAGYLGRGDGRNGVRVGAYSGLVTSIPVIVLFAFLIGGAAVVGVEIGVGLGAAAVALILLVALAVTVLTVVGLSALGGYLGVEFSERST
ncbi:hypothetical protein SAMN05216388_100874 [Halorientalis persicus]|jgi:hypothetical protein|uniref:Uncharacterized protein n=1 Tax=Halorientalis persicus TaxID=1367881 RepID=A0A1H8M0X1_9EURY|nr:DUF5518 domain-containing protein [Halorientalis persicus]SEO10786.1 hypothetical protein SAMN05216388_100874 [Halorientalis persicus]